MRVLCEIRLGQERVLVVGPVDLLHFRGNVGEHFFGLIQPSGLHQHQPMIAACQQREGMVLPQRPVGGILQPPQRIQSQRVIVHHRQRILMIRTKDDCGELDRMGLHFDGLGDFALLAEQVHQVARQSQRMRVILAAVCHHLVERIAIEGFGLGETPLADAQRREVVDHA